MDAAGLGVHTCVIRQRIDTRSGQLLGHLFNASTRLAVNHAGVTIELGLDKRQQLRHRIALFGNSIADVGAIKTADELARCCERQVMHHVLSRQCISSCR